ncbi:hypothetical protein GYMLUDRAFT_84977 [Collybiopsis luxurians FD-317 M1]|uniref:Uncharacterized protein n=1 Tax=Collybiopsis luxurians FD-317 M1 TaxID=944289 RepID=A0A0D0BCH2_9AGAR|nr:hypothetical protein GYMLUDRAFT_84977 [Collybiopsis luxurians FD-317 M1]
MRLSTLFTALALVTGVCAVPLLDGKKTGARGLPLYRGGADQRPAKDPHSQSGTIFRVTFHTGPQGVAGHNQATEHEAQQVVKDLLNFQEAKRAVGLPTSQNSHIEFQFTNRYPYQEIPQGGSVLFEFTTSPTLQNCNPKCSGWAAYSDSNDHSDPHGMIQKSNGNVIFDHLSQN